MSDNPYRNLPAVNDLLEVAALRELIGAHGREQVVDAVRAELDELRDALKQGAALDGRQAGAAFVSGRADCA